MKVGKLSEKTGRFVEKVGRYEVKEGGFRKKVHYFFDPKGLHSKNPNFFFKNCTIIRKKNIIFALDKTQLSPFLSSIDIDIVRLPWTILLWFSTNDL